MPVQPTYPGVYIEEIPSGVRTITGVSTSVAAFVGSAKRGPINKAVHILSYADFERAFGGLDAGSEMSYGVRQFFLNGGTDAWVVRLAKGAVAASRDLVTDTAQPSLKITALEDGLTGNLVEVRVDRQTANPASTFNLTLISASPDNPGNARTERFENLSMNSKDPRYVVGALGDSGLVKIERTASLAGLVAGTSTSGSLDDVATVLDATHNQFLIAVNGLEPVTVSIDLPGDVAGANAAARLATLCGKIKDKVQAQAGGRQPLAAFDCAPSADDKRIVMTSGDPGEASSVRVLPGGLRDASVRLKLGAVNGGEEKDAVAALRPREMPDRGSLTSGVLADADLAGPPAVPAANLRSFQLSLDGGLPDAVDIGLGAVAGANLGERLANLAGRIQAAVRLLKPGNPAYAGFVASVDANKLVLASGTRGAGSSVQASAVAGDDLATRLKLLAGAVSAAGKAETLQGGNEQPLTEADFYNAFIASRADRKGIYALEAVDLFNILCLPGITDPGVLADADAYCHERRAFFIIDAPPAAKDPATMVTTISGSSLPKSDYAAVYFPWIDVADPLNGGRLRRTAPCGTIAGLYARTDASRGVWKAPAGTEATLTGVLKVEYNLTDRENGTLNPLGVNCIRALPVFGPVSWGARTLRGADALTSEWKYIPVRRLALYIEESLYRGTQWVVFEPNDEPLWSQIRLNLGAFMHTLFRQGAFQGRTPREAYLVKCDRDTTTQDDINRGIVNIVVGFAPLKPAEFVIIKIQQLAGQVQA
jgi:phage tail sheath protein FI